MPFRYLPRADAAVIRGQVETERARSEEVLDLEGLARFDALEVLGEARRGGLADKRRRGFDKILELDGEFHFGGAKGVEDGFGLILFFLWCLVCWDEVFKG